jgi:hypothetical protein
LPTRQASSCSTTPPFPKPERIPSACSASTAAPRARWPTCQAAVSLHYVGRQGHVPLGLRLFLPDVWLQAPARLDKAGVPQSERRALTKGEIALELLDAVRAEGVLPGQVVVADSGYGVSGPLLRAGLAARGLHYLLGVSPREMVAFTAEPRWQEPGPRADGRPGGRAPRRRHRLCKACAPPLSLRAVAARRPRCAKSPGVRAPRGRWLAALPGRRVWPAHGWATGETAPMRSRSGCSSKKRLMARSSMPSATYPWAPRESRRRCGSGGSAGRSSRAISR